MGALHTEMYKDINTKYTSDFKDLVTSKKKM